MPKVKQRKVVTVAEFNKWFDNLDTLAQMNFTTLIGLPTALEVITKMAEGKYKEMALLGIALVKEISKVKNIDQLLDNLENAKD